MSTVVAIKGTNGSGKSTVVRELIARVRPLLRRQAIFQELLTADRAEAISPLRAGSLMLDPEFCKKTLERLELS